MFSLSSVMSSVICDQSTINNQAKHYPTCSRSARAIVCRACCCTLKSLLPVLLLLHRDHLHGLTGLHDLSLDHHHRLYPRASTHTSRHLLHLLLLRIPRHLRLHHLTLLNLHLLLRVCRCGVRPLLRLLLRLLLLPPPLQQRVSPHGRPNDNGQHREDATNSASPISFAFAARVVLAGAVDHRGGAPAPR